MVGCGGFGAANAGAAIIVRAAAKEPAIVAFAIVLLEFMGASFPGNIRRCGSTAWTHHRFAEESDDGGACCNPCVDVTHLALLHYRPPPPNPVIGPEFYATPHIYFPSPFPPPPPHPHP